MSTLEEAMSARRLNGEGWANLDEETRHLLRQQAKRYPLGALRTYFDPETGAKIVESV